MLARIMTDLRPSARLYVGGVIAGGAWALVASLPPRVTEPVLFPVLLATAVAAAAWKTSLPLTRTGTTISMSYVVFLVGAIVLGRFEALAIGAAGAWVQCEYRPQVRYPIYRTVFSAATVVLAVAASGAVLDLMVGEPVASFPELIPPVLVAGAAFFVVNSGLVAVAIRLATGQPLTEAWVKSMTWCVPAYLVGAAIAAACAAVVATHWLVAASLLLPAYAGYALAQAHAARLRAA